VTSEGKERIELSPTRQKGEKKGKKRCLILASSELGQTQSIANSQRKKEKKEDWSAVHVTSRNQGQCISPHKDRRDNTN